MRGIPRTLPEIDFLRPVVVLQEEVLQLEVRLELLPEDLGPNEVAGPYADPGHLVLVAGTDPPGGRPDLAAAELLLPPLVERDVVREDHVGQQADLELRVVRKEPALLQPVDLREEHLRVDHHAVADDAPLPRMEDARGDEVEDELLALDDEGVPGVVASRRANDRVGEFGIDVDDLALASSPHWAPTTIRFSTAGPPSRRGF
jgi:hypothetical protein